jgi:hypothetical protein
MPQAERLRDLVLGAPCLAEDEDLGLSGLNRFMFPSLV